MSRHSKTIVLSAVLLAVLMGTTGCSTMRGFGQDLEKLGDKIAKTADRSPENSDKAD